MRLIGLRIAVLAGVLFSRTALATPRDAATAHWSQLGWTWQPWVVISLSLATWGYIWGVRRLNADGRPRVLGIARCVSFAMGMATLCVALISPLDALDDQLFSAHMVQHLLLMMVAAPLLVWARPAIAWLWAFPLPARRAIGSGWVGSGLHDGVRRLMSPMMVWALCSMALWFWHLPGPYGWALANEWIHSLEHFCFFTTALMFWSLVLEPYGRRRLGYGSSLIFVATLGMQNGLLGALLTFAGRALYVAHANTTQAWGLTPLEDQQLAGLIMWIPASIIHLTTLSMLFVAWMRAQDAPTIMRAPLRPHVTLRCALIMPLLLTVLLSGCKREITEPPWQIARADAKRGPALFDKYGCGSCHTVPGVRNARGTVGPPLANFGQRVYIAGMLPNTPPNLIRWLRAPQTVIPGNAMPDMGVTEQDARDLAAFLDASP